MILVSDWSSDVCSSDLLHRVGLREDHAARAVVGVLDRGHVIYPPTTLVEIENTHNRSGGVIFPQADAVKVCAAAREIGRASCRVAVPDSACGDVVTED